MRTSYLIDAVALVVGALVMGVAFWSLGKTDPMWAIISFVLVYDPEARVLKTACLRLGGTIAGSALAIGVLAICGVEKWALPAGIAAAAVLCGIFQMPRPVLRVVLVTVALIIGSAILQASLGPYIAVARSIEVTAGSLLAVVFSWGVGRLGGRGEV